ncbi:MAG TPA: heme lyase CcmF/NrfE family subunit [Caulobacterales bacterium]|nr:heme lyase CcmF/NrfE family subunit [Caulobacterales bacterium]
MITELGLFLAALALIASLAQAGFGLYGGHKGDARASAASAACAQVAAFGTVAALALLIAAFIRSDFSLAVVANNSHTDKPLLYKIAGAWGNHEGSMLLWCTVSAVFGALFASTPGKLAPSLWSRAIGVQGAVTAGALIYTLFLSSPFARLVPAPLQGASLNPLLQDPALAMHPPMLYLGYVGLSMPYSIAIAGLIEGKVDQAWARAARPWILIAWICLTIGIAAGSYWAYYELGWGGWWFWDPVENASFMPWLSACALLHSAVVTERRGSLAGWTILLAIIGFGFALLGTFLVRSGVLTSVHAFAVDPQRGYAVLTLFVLALGVGFGLYAWRAPQLSRPSGFVAFSREGALVLNNLGLSVACATVLIGTLYPLLAQAMGAGLISVGPPFFNLTFAPLMALTLIALPFGPLLAWRRGDMKAALHTLWLAGAGAAGAALGVLLLTTKGISTALGLALGAWLLIGSGAYLWRRIRQARGVALPLAVWAMSAAHLGLGVFVIGAVSETSFRQERSALMAPGDVVDFAGEKIKLAEVGSHRGPNYTAEFGRFESAGNVMTAERRFYPASQQTTSEVAIRPSLGGDLYIALGDRTKDAGTWTVRLYRNPLIELIYLGCAMMALGGGLALLRLARRRETAPAPEAAPAPRPATASL